MPIYVYECQTCELELEEMHALGQAPERSIRCPLCGSYFERAISLFQVRKSTHHQADPNGTADRQTDQNRTTDRQTDKKLTRPLRHALDCLCCRPMRRR